MQHQQGGLNLTYFFQRVKVHVVKKFSSRASQPALRATAEKLSKADFKIRAP